MQVATKEAFRTIILHATSVLAVAALSSTALAQMSPVGGEFQVNSTTALSQYGGNVAMDASGNFLIVWAGAGEGDLRGRFYGPNGVPAGPDFPVAPGSSGGARIARSALGPFLAVWSSSAPVGPDSDEASVQARLLGSDGSPSGAAFQVNQTTAGDQHEGRVGVDGNGNFVVVWTDERFPESGTYSTVQGQRIDENGARIGDELDISHSLLSRRAGPVVASPIGGFLAILSGAVPSDDHILVLGRAFDENGAPRGGEFQINQFSTGLNRFASVAALGQDRFVVVWESDESTGPDSDATSIHARFVEVGGFATGNQFQVNSSTTGQQSIPAAIAAPDGGFVVVWSSTSSSGSDQSSFSVQGQRFRADGTRLGGEFQVNTYTTSFQTASGIAAAPDGTFVVTWASDGSSGTDTSGTSVQAQRYADLFLDGFESGASERWSSTSP